MLPKHILEQMKQRKIMALISKSGVGKSTIGLGLINKNMCDKSEDYSYVPSFTDRAERVYDPKDKLTHKFVDSQHYEDNINDIIAVYNSPKGYRNYTTIESFDPHKINIYAIDSVAYMGMKEIIPNMIGIYLDIDEETRKNRFLHREGSLDGFSDEYHLSKEIMGDSTEYHCIDTMGKTPQEIIQEINIILKEEGIL